MEKYMIHIKKISGILLMALLIVAGLTACSDDDGDWNPMKWKTDVKMAKGHVVSVPVDGGTYQFTCKNYGSFWFSGIYEDGIYVEEGYYDANLIIGKWSRMTADKRVLTVEISPNDSGKQRTVEGGVTVGDAFDDFTFNQAGQ